MTSGGKVMDYGQIGGETGGVRYRYLTHRLAYELANDIKLTPEQCVLHRCDNPPCCNPAHLFLGDRATNNADRRAKGRTVQVNLVGEEHGMSKLTADKVRALRGEYAAGGIGQIPLAKKYGITQATCWAIIHMKTWKHVV